MTLKEFLQKNPTAVEEAAKCTTLEEFKTLTEQAGITFGSPEKLEKAFELVKSQAVNELSDDALNTVSGGRVYTHNKDDVTFNKKGDALIAGKGKKS